LSKAKISTPKNIKYISINLNKDSLENTLSIAGFDTGKEALFLLEGISYYLEPGSIDNALESMKNILHSGSSLAFDYVVTILPENIHKYYGMKEAGVFMSKSNPNEGIKCTIEEGEIGPFLQQRGFQLIEHLNTKEIEDKYLMDKGNILIGKMLGAFRFAIASTMNSKV
jgi:methyltransferase (TIGR00027 family)